VNLREGEGDPDGDEEDAQDEHADFSPAFTQTRVEGAERAVDGDGTDHADGVK
jgi:hypothetical protein